MKNKGEKKTVKALFSRECHMRRVFGENNLRSLQKSNKTNGTESDDISVSKFFACKIFK